MTDLSLEWVTCDGGPLLLLDEQHLDSWEGSHVPSNGRCVEARFRWNPNGPATDYDRACDVDDYLGLINVGEGQALVLGDAPFSTTWIPLTDGGILVRWVYADNEADFMAAVNPIPSGVYQDTGLIFSVRNYPLVLFAACESWEDKIYPRLKIDLPAGHYRVLTGEYEEGGQTSIICHRMQRIDEAS